MTKLRILIGDITQSDADIIVFSAHPSLLSGSGVSRVIHKFSKPFHTNTLSG